MKTIFVIFITIAFFVSTEIAIGADWHAESIKRFEAADAKLDKVFQQVVAEVKNKHPNDPFLSEWIEQISLAQKAWKEFRDHDQQAAAFFWRGGGTGRAQMEWATRLTLQRIEDLKKRYDPR